MNKLRHNKYITSLKKIKIDNDSKNKDKTVIFINSKSLIPICLKNVFKITTNRALPKLCKKDEY